MFTDENANANMREGNKWITKPKGMKKSTQMGIMKNKTDANGQYHRVLEMRITRFYSIQHSMYMLKKWGSTFSQCTKEDTSVMICTKMQKGKRNNRQDAIAIIK